MKTFISSLTIVAALTLSGAAFAQPTNTIGGQTIDADQMDEVQAACDKLAAGTSTPMAGGTSNDSGDSGDSSSGDGSSDDSSSDDGGTSGDSGTTGSGDGQTETESTDEWDVTAEQCMESGFTAAPAN